MQQSSIKSSIMEKIGRVSIRDVIAAPTEVRQELASNFVEMATGLNQGDFDEPKIEVEEEEEFEEEDLVQHQGRDRSNFDAEYDAEKNAKALVYTLFSVDQLVLSTVATVKARKQAGGKKVIDAMKRADAKKLRGDKLEENEVRLADGLAVFKNSLNSMSDDLFPDQKRIDQMIELATSYCEETQFKVGTSMAFWSNYIGYTAERIMKITMK